MRKFPEPRTASRARAGRGHEHGLFTFALERPLEERRLDADPDGLLSTDERRLPLATQVEERSRGAQHPTVDRDDLLLDVRLPLARGTPAPYLTLLSCQRFQSSSGTSAST